MIITLLEAETGDTSAPTLATDGQPIRRKNSTREGLRDGMDEMMLEVSADRTAGSALSFKLRLFVYDAELAKWFPLGIGAGSSKGYVNDDDAIDETASTEVRHTERIAGLKDFDRVAMQITNFAGSGLTADGINARLKRRGSAQ
jgi:hypothetical protein